MHDFRVTDSSGRLHPVEGPCAECAVGYPVPCPRITGAAVQPTGYDRAGRAMKTEWVEETCPGTVHAEVGPTGALELRCAACGVTP
jgi:hypothetical protein